MSAACIQELQACLSSLSGVASKLVATCGTASIRLQKQRASSSWTQWQCETDEGWQNYDKPVNDMLQSAQGRLQDKISFRLNGVA